MPHAAGTRLGPYQIVAPLGAGGMGEVYRARDSRLGRDVALKVLPEAFANDEERMARFEREAQVLASLNHPNIAAIYGLEGSAIVMELVEGPTLAERIAAGAIPLEQALPVARQIAEALEAAHEKAIVHRDLKPANIKVTPQGTVKVLDFGLAKALSGDPATGDPAQSPTLSLAATRAGVILGTAGYMSPEQARGGAADRRADVWAFGVVLYEMLTGRQTFGGPTVSDTLAAVLKTEPDWSALPAETPPAIRRLLRRCLEKDPRRRLHDIADARLEMEEALGPPELGAVAAPPLRARRRPLVLPGAMLLAALAGAALVWIVRPAPPVPPLRKLEVPLPQLANAFGTPFALSPDGRRIAYITENRLWIRELDQFEPHEVTGSGGALRPFWSPDSSSVGYFAGGKMWRAAASGGGGTTICTTPAGVSDAGGGVWTADGRVVFATGSSGLLAVSANGGDAKPLLEPDPQSEADFHHVAPLPGSSGAVFVVHRKGGGYDTLAVFDGRRRKIILKIDGQQLSNPAYSPTGHILYHRAPENPGVWALPFSLSKLEATGEPFLAFPNANFPSVSSDATLAMVRQAGSWSIQLVWLNSSGQVQGKIGEPLPLASFPALSPDGRRLAVAAIDPAGADLWVYDLGRGARTRLTFSPESDALPVWSPAGDRIAFMTGNSPASFAISWKAADGTGQSQELLKGLTPSFSPDGKFLLYTSLKDANTWNLGYLPLTGERKPALFLESAARKQSPRVSPDGQYVAYMSTESGREEIYLTRFPTGDGKWQVSVNGGFWPHWSAKGDRLFYTEPDNTLVEVEVSLRPSVQLGAPRKLFARQRSGAPTPGGWPDGFDVAPNGTRFVVAQAADQRGPASITVVEGWYQEFRGRR